MTTNRHPQISQITQKVKSAKATVGDKAYQSVALAYFLNLCNLRNLRIEFEL